MTLMISLAVVVCIIALVITLILTQSVDPDYDKNKNITKLSVIYIALIPLLSIIIALVWIYL
ncbi:hypothetical protein [Halalkalibacter akibai]|uniref:BshB3 potential contributor to bacillithiol synthesis n=1 Tax=Halalkalibacter akibai (strain ATCC 43226 / DSM 21942 / CIP 109018 / JCM 9157 / 1139) TaxID=1236973 RepID=W4QSP4_HALA3|nr:hypothetical protein [Halalkalibacter akibai]GAE34359.1 hypothetical protein JCM9157_1410 [Halalkalibacter akibai JCM 9157]